MRTRYRHFLALVLVVLSFGLSVPADAATRPNKDRTVNQYLNQLDKQAVALQRARDVYTDQRTQHPQWTIQGEIIRRSGNSLTVWGKALSTGAPRQHPGWALDDSNLMIFGFDQDEVAYNSYYGGLHYFIRETSGKNGYGQAVPVKVYGPAPEALVKAQDEYEGRQRDLTSTVEELREYSERQFIDSKRADSYIQLAEFYVSVHQSLWEESEFVSNLWARAIEHYEKAFSLNKSKDVGFRIAALMIEDGNSAKAISYYEAIIAQEPQALLRDIQEADRVLLIGQAYMNTRELELAAEALRSAEAIVPGTDVNEFRAELAAQLFKRGTQRSKSGQLTEAASDLNLVLGIVADSIEYFAPLAIETNRNLADIYERQGQTESAKIQLLSAINLYEEYERDPFGEDQELTGARSGLDSMQLARLYEKTKDWATVYEQLNRAFSLYGYTQSLDLADAGLFHKAGSEVHYLLSRVYLEEAGRYSMLDDDSRNQLDTLAVGHLQQAVAQLPEQPLYHNALGVALMGTPPYRQESQVEAAVDSFIRAIALAPDYSTAYFNLRDALYTIDGYERFEYHYWKNRAEYNDLMEQLDSARQPARKTGRLEPIEEALEWLDSPPESGKSLPNWFKQTFVPQDTRQKSRSTAAPTGAQTPTTKQAANQPGDSKTSKVAGNPAAANMQTTKTAVNQNPTPPVQQSSVGSGISPELALSVKAHEYGTISLAWSPNGKYLVTAGDRGDARLILWDANTGEQIRTFSGYSQPIGSLAWDSEGNHFAGGGTDNAVRIWSIDKAEPVQVFHTTEYSWEGRVKSIAWSPDGNQIVAAGDSGTVWVFDWNSNSLVHQWRYDPDSNGETVNTVAWSKNSNLIAAGGSGPNWAGSIQLWSMADKQRLTPLKGHRHEISTLDFSSVTGRLASGSEDKTLRVWNCQMAEQVFEIKLESQIYDLSWDPPGEIIAVASNDDLTLWNGLTGEHIAKLEDPLRYSVAWSPDGTRLATGGSGETVKIWRIR